LNIEKNIEKIDIDIDIEEVFNGFIFNIDIVSNSMFWSQYIEKSSLSLSHRNTHTQEIDRSIERVSERE